MSDRTPYKKTYTQAAESPSSIGSKRNDNGGQDEHGHQPEQDSDFYGRSKEDLDFRKQLRLDTTAAQVRILTAEASIKKEHSAILQAQARHLNASAKKTENEVKIREAQASEAQLVADKASSRHRLALATGWTELILLPLLFAALMIVGFRENPMAYSGGIMAGLGFYSWKPWKLVFPPYHEKEGPPSSTGVGE